jgi:tRNA dimethylallyltransferase
MSCVSRSVDHETSHNRVVSLAGSTAAGKSSLAMQLAGHFRLAIVNADAMQLYRGMDIGTAKATSKERAEVPHVGLDLLDVDETASVVEFRDQVRTEIQELWKLDLLPVVVGGSLLYLRALCDELDIPPTDAGVRAKYEAQLAELGPELLHVQLVAVAPDAAAHIQSTNGRRIVRALEVVELTGEFKAQMPPPTPWAPTLWLGIASPRDRLDSRIADRVLRMWANGLVDEVRSLRDTGLESGRTASKAVGYREVLQYLDGTLTADEAQAAAILSTRRLARRQERAFRANKRIEWFDAAEPDLLARVSTQIAGFAPGYEKDRS